MAEIVPCITVENEDMYKEAMQRVSSFTKRVHIDIADGEFAPTFLVAADKIWWPAEWQANIHAMVARPSEYVDGLIAMKPSLITFHVEVEEELLPIIQKIKAAGINAGIALQRATVPSSVQSLIEAADHVLVFSGELGHYGGTASMMQLEKVRLIRNIRPSIEVSWDGGVTIENAFSLSQGGIDVLNVGGTIAKSDDPATTYQALVKESTKHGVI